MRIGSIGLGSVKGQHGVDFSVALSTYNGAKYLRTQLESLVSQTRLPAELVVVDDCSTDGSVQIVTDFARRAPFPVRIFRNPLNLGWQDSFVKAALECAHDWVAFCDQDDYWFPSKLERITVFVASNTQLSMVVHSAEMTNEDLMPLGQRLPRFRRTMVREPLCNPPILTQLGFATAFSRSLLDGIPTDKRPCDPNIPSRRQSHDQLITLLSNVLGRVGYLSDVLAYYRRHSTTATGLPGSGRHRRDLLSRLRGIVSAGQDRYEFLSDIARRNAAFLRLCAANSESKRRSRFFAGASFYDRLGETLQRRSSLYSGSLPIDQKLASFIGLLFQNAYVGGSTEAKLGIGALLKDATVLVLPHDFVTAPNFALVRPAAGQVEKLNS
jgi:glycosyltransferase involved in cell wall biosynthesis